MKKYILLLSLFLLTSCFNSNNNSENISQENNSELVSWDISDITVDLDANFDYLDSVELSYKNEKFSDILAENDYAIVYFYPYDFTPYCTIQAIDFSTMKNDFEKEWYQIIWVSRNDISSHKEFAEANSLTIKLIEDKDSILLDWFKATWNLDYYWNWEDKTDIIRSTFIIDNKWNPIASFKDVDAVWHAQRVYDYILNLKK